LEPEHLQLNENFDDYPDNDELKDVNGDEGMKDLNMND